MWESLNPLGSYNKIGAVSSAKKLKFPRSSASRKTLLYAQETLRQGRDTKKHKETRQQGISAASRPVTHISAS